MKKSVLTIAVLAAGFLFSLDNVQAQKGFQLGIEGTPQFSWIINMDDVDSDDFKYKNAFNSSFGISSQFGFTDQAGIGLNVLYSFQGQRYTWRNKEYYSKLQYVKIPLMFTTSLSLGDNAMFVGKIGPQLGLLVEAELENKDGDKYSIDYDKAYEKYDVGGMLSAGWAYFVSDYISIDIAFRADFGFTNAEDEDYTDNIHYPMDILPSPRSSPRKIGSNMTTGLTVGVRYVFL